MVSQSARHRWRHAAEYFVLKTKVLPRDEQSRHRGMMANAFAVRDRQESVMAKLPGESERRRAPHLKETIFRYELRHGGA